MADERAGARAVHRIARDLPIGEGDSPDSVGFKAYNLSRMARLGLDVPPCIVIGTGYCDAPAAVIPSLWADDLAWLEASTGLGFGDRRRPLLLSVRSGAPVSMPGMMETLLNIGLTERTLPGLIRLTGNPRLAWDAYRRLIASFGEVVEGLEASIFEADLKAVVAGREERDLDFADMRVLTQRHLETYRRGAGAAFPDDPHEQLRRAVEAVFRSWSSAKAGTYRQMHRLSESMGTAVTIQQMVFGNAGGLSGAGVGFTRNPIDGNPAPWVDFLFNAQGEDVVSGRRNASVGEELAFVAPAIWDQLRAACASLEREFLDMQDFEFTLQSGRLFMLQTRDGKRMKQAAARIALDMHDEGLIDSQVALARTDKFSLADLEVAQLAGEHGEAPEPVAQASSAAFGVAAGKIAFDEEAAHRYASEGHAVILVRRDAETRDIAALELASGLLTRNGSRTSHAAVVARQLGKVCLVGCASLEIDLQARQAVFQGMRLAEGALVTIDGNGGGVYVGRLALVRRAPKGLWERLESFRQSACCLRTTDAVTI